LKFDDLFTVNLTTNSVIEDYKFDVTKTDINYYNIYFNNNQLCRSLYSDIDTNLGYITTELHYSNVLINPEFGIFQY